MQCLSTAAYILLAVIVLLIAAASGSSTNTEGEAVPIAHAGAAIDSVHVEAVGTSWLHATWSLAGNQSLPANYSYRLSCSCNDHPNDPKGSQYERTTEPWGGCYGLRPPGALCRVSVAVVSDGGQESGPVSVQVLTKPFIRSIYHNFGTSFAFNATDAEAAEVTVEWNQNTAVGADVFRIVAQSNNSGAVYEFDDAPFSANRSSKFSNFEFSDLLLVNVTPVATKAGLVQNGDDIQLRIFTPPASPQLELVPSNTSLVAAVECQSASQWLHARLLSNASQSQSRSCRVEGRDCGCNLTFSSLRPHSLYSVQASALWQQLQSPSTTEEAWTLEAASSEPRQLEVTNVTHQAATVQFLQPLEPNGPMLAFVLRAMEGEGCAAGAVLNMTEAACGADCSAEQLIADLCDACERNCSSQQQQQQEQLEGTVSGLQAGRQYQLQVAPIGRTQLGRSASVEVRTGDTRPSAPRSLAAEFGETTATLSWRLPARGEVDKFLLRLRPACANESLRPLPGSRTNFTFASLSQCCDYAFSVAGVNRFGEGEAASGEGRTLAASVAELGGGRVNQSDVGQRLLLTWPAPRAGECGVAFCPSLDGETLACVADAQLLLPLPRDHTLRNLTVLCQVADRANRTRSLYFSLRIGRVPDGMNIVTLLLLAAAAALLLLLLPAVAILLLRICCS